MAGVLMVLMTSLNERRREMAIHRSVSARPVHIVSLILMESFSVTLAGLITGLCHALHCGAVSAPLAGRSLWTAAQS